MFFLCVLHWTQIHCTSCCILCVHNMCVFYLYIGIYLNSRQNIPSCKAELFYPARSAFPVLTQRSAGCTHFTEQVTGDSTSPMTTISSPVLGTSPVPAVGVFFPCSLLGCQEPELVWRCRGSRSKGQNEVAKWSLSAWVCGPFPVPALALHGQWVKEPPGCFARARP